MGPGKRHRKASAALAALVLLGSCGGGGSPAPTPTPTPTPPPSAGADFAITNVRILDTEGLRTLDAMTVRVKGGTILEVGETASTASDATVTIDGSGKVVMPGLIDAHVHVYNDYELPLFPANGVTTVRNMWGTPGILALREQVRAGSLLGPEIVTSGPIIDGSPPFWPTSDVATTAQGARALVRDHKAAGYDFIKVYFRLSSPVFDAIAEESQAQGLRYAGHAPRDKGVEAVYASDIWSVEHLDGYLLATLNPASGYDPANPDIADLFAVLRDIRDGRRPFSDLFLPAERQRLARVSSSAGTVHVPTMSLWQQRYLTRAEVAAQQARPELRFIHPAVRTEWADAANALFARYTDEEIELLDLQHDEDYRIIMAIAAEGGDIPTGTDARNPYVLFGFSMHEELEHYVEAGMSEMEALSWATWRAASFLGLQGSIGAIKAGYEADFVLLDADPTASIGNTRSIASLFLDGRRYTRAQLDNALETVAASF